nr:ribonuclease H-like domain, reverse transcriptase, RNA-dependent DNA polymerase [Tanacetum cinerariifolium]
MHHLRGSVYKLLIYRRILLDNDKKGKKITEIKICSLIFSQVEQIFQEELEKLKRQEKEANDATREEATHENQNTNTNNTNLLNAFSAPVSAVGPSRALNDDEPSYPADPSMPHLEDIYASLSAGIFTNSSYDDEGVVTNFNNLETTMNTRSKVHKNSKARALNPKRSLKHWKIKVRLMLCKRNCCSSKFRRQEEGIDYDEFFAPVVRIEALRIFLAFASYMGFIIYQMDVKSAFLYGTIDEEVYVTQPPRFVDPKFPNKVYKVVKALYGLHQAPRACVKTTSTLIDTQKPLVKDEEATDVDVYLYRSMISSLMYLTASRSNIMFAFCACSRFQVTPKTSHLQAVKRIFRDAYEKKLIQVLKIHTDDNVADLLTKAFDGGYLKFLLLSNGYYCQVSVNAAKSGDMSHHQDIYDNPSITKKVSANMKRVGTGFSEVITPLFESMLVQDAEEVGEAQDDVSIPTAPSTSKPYKKHKSKKQKLIAPKVPSPAPSSQHIIPSPTNDPILDVDKDSLKFQELMGLCIRLSNKVLDLESAVIVKSSFTHMIAKLEDRVHKLEEENRILKETSFKYAKVDTATPVEDKEESFKQERMIADMDKDVEDTDEEEPAEVEEVLKVVTAAKLMTKVVTTAAQVPKPSAPKRRRRVIIQDPEETATSVIMHTEYEAFVRQLEAELNANINWNDDVEQVKRSEKQNNEVMSEIRTIFEKHYNSIQAFLKEVEEEVTVQEIVANDDDDVFTEATPLASKVPVVDYQIHHENNKRYYKIIRADGTHKLFLSFITLLKNFDREDLEALWKLVKERFKTKEPKNFSDDFLLNILKIMFEKPNIEASVWKDQKGKYGLAKIKS